MRTSAEIRLAEDHELRDRMMLKDDCIRIMFTAEAWLPLKNWRTTSKGNENNKPNSTVVNSRWKHFKSAWTD